MHRPRPLFQESTGNSIQTAAGVNMRPSSGTFTFQIPSQLWSYQERITRRKQQERHLFQTLLGLLFLLNYPPTFICLPPNTKESFQVYSSRINDSDYHRKTELSVFDRFSTTYSISQVCTERGAVPPHTGHDSHTTIPPKRWKMLRRSW